jgi:hypothetical protein
MEFGKLPAGRRLHLHGERGGGHRSSTWCNNAQYREKIGGTIDLKSTAGVGTTFTIKIPLTLAIVSALIVEAGSERFAIPQISVVELVRAQKEAGRGHNEPGGTETVIERINDTPVLRLRDRLLPLVNLNDLLGLGESHNDDSGAYIVVAQVGANSLGIIVDRVFHTEEIVVKPVTRRGRTARPWMVGSGASFRHCRNAEMFEETLSDHEVAETLGNVWGSSHFKRTGSSSISRRISIFQ